MKLVLIFLISFSLLSSFALGKPSFEIATKASPEISNTQVIPPTGNIYTTFLIKSNASDISGISSVTAYIRNSTNEVDTIKLYDDGLHSDGASRDGVYGNLWMPASHSLTRYFIDINATDNLGNSDKKQNEATFDVINMASVKCIDYLINGDSSNKLDILFVGDNFNENELQTLENDVISFSNALFVYEPFSTNSNKINIRWMNLSDSFNCYTSCGSCNFNKIYSSVAGCPFDYIVIVTKGNPWGSGSSLRSCAFAGVDGISTFLEDAFIAYGKPNAFPHEFGHSFGNLMDEYNSEQSTSSKSNFVNCDDSSSCTKWNTVPGTGCFAGCYFNNWYRPTSNSCLMYSLNGIGFDPVDKPYLSSLFGAYS